MFRLLFTFLLAAVSASALAEPALSVLGKDYTFPNQINGLPNKLSDFKTLQINSFQTGDGVKLAYWEAGEGEPLIFIPAWSSNGAEYINVIYLLSRQYHVYVLEMRNHGLSDRVDYGNRISRYAMDVKEFNQHLGLKSAAYVGWSMGVSVIWSYIDLFGTQDIDKLVFIDQVPSIYSRDDWSEEERLNAGGMTNSPEQLIALLTNAATPQEGTAAAKLLARATAMDSPFYRNSTGFTQTFIANNMSEAGRVLFDHITNDWRDVISHKINVPTAIFTGEYSDNVPSQRWIAATIPDARLYIYGKKEQGDHFLALKNPFKFTEDLTAFLQRK